MPLSTRGTIVLRVFFMTSKQAMFVSAMVSLEKPSKVRLRTARQSFAVHLLISESIRSLLDGVTHALDTFKCLADTRCVYDGYSQLRDISECLYDLCCCE